MIDRSMRIFFFLVFFSQQRSEWVSESSEWVSESILLFDSIQFLVVGLGSTYCNGMLYVYVVFLCVVLVGCFVSTSCSLVSMMMLHQKSKYRRKSFKNNVVTHICTVQYYSSIILAPQDVRNHDVMMDRREKFASFIFSLQSIMLLMPLVVTQGWILGYICICILPYLLVCIICIYSGWHVVY